jgi:hypothetical protein
MNTQPRDSIIIGYDGFKHYVVGRFEATKLEPWLAARFPEELRKI